MILHSFVYHMCEFMILFLRKTAGEAPTGSFSFILTKNVYTIVDYKSNQKRG
jgi:hypothetical protein